jgi:hypothetical protein
MPEIVIDTPDGPFTISIDIGGRPRRWKVA